MSDLTYLNLDLRLERDATGYRLRVVSSPVGETVAPFTPPVSGLELENFMLRVGRRRSGMRRYETAAMSAAKEMGGRLFGAVFQGEVEDLFLRSVQEAQRQGAGLRVRLDLTQAPDLADLPWEYVYNPALNRFLALSTETPLVRYVELPDVVQPLAVRPPLKILVIIASATDYDPLDVEREWSKLQEAVAGLGANQVILERLEPPSLAALPRRLRQGGYHILHFIGHGGFDQRAQDGVLLFEDENELGLPVSGQQLGMLLRDYRSLRLVVLNACEGARAAASDPFAGVAQSLVQQGLPAVIAMQFEITDEAAITLAREFYTALADGYPVDAALGEARKAILADGNELEWGTPVLYMRTPDGRIFDVAATTEAPRRHETVQRKVLDEMFLRGLSALYTERWDEAIETLGAVVAESPDHPEAARRLEEAQRGQRLAQLYQAALPALNAQDWDTAVERLETIVQLDPNYRDAQARLATVRQQKTLAGLYAEARQLGQIQEWPAVLKVFERIQALDAAYPDPDRWLAAARAGVAQGEREKTLADLYRQALQLIDEAKWREALSKLDEVRKRQPDYLDVKALRQQVQDRLKGQVETDRAEQGLAALYDQAQTYEGRSDRAKARQTYRDIAKRRAGFRDVEARLAALDAALATPKATPMPQAAPTAQRTPIPWRRWLLYAVIGVMACLLATFAFGLYYSNTPTYIATQTARAEGTASAATQTVVAAEAPAPAPTTAPGAAPPAPPLGPRATVTPAPARPATPTPPLRP